MQGAAKPMSVDRVQRWIVVYLAVISGEASDTIDVDAPLSRFDLDSVDAVEMASEFEKAFSYEIGPAFFLRPEPSVRELAAELVALAGARAA